MIDKIDENEVLDFITNFLYHQSKDIAVEVLLKQFKQGYCYHFASILRDTFHRGVVCWAAPTGHIVWKDIDGNYYDIEGKYNGSALYFIPVWYLGEYVREFLHITTDNHPNSTKQKLLDIVKKYCDDNKLVYDENIEEQFNYGKRY